MVTSPRLLDLFCGQGGAGEGYARAGFEVVGVDLEPQPRSPHTFVQGDALEYVKANGHLFDVIHASPPCQAYSITKHTHNVTHPDLVGPTRDALVATGLPYVIENVPGAPLLQPVTLCGTEFALPARDNDGRTLQLRRPRLFESNRFLLGAGGCMHGHPWGVGGVYGGGSSDRNHAREVRRGG